MYKQWRGIISNCLSKVTVCPLTTEIYTMATPRCELSSMMEAHGNKRLSFSTISEHILLGPLLQGRRERILFDYDPSLSSQTNPLFLLILAPTIWSSKPSSFLSPDKQQLPLSDDACLCQTGGLETSIFLGFHFPLFSSIFHLSWKDCYW